MSNALTLLVLKADAVACVVRKADAAARVVWTTFAVALFVQKANALPISVKYVYARAVSVCSGMCADTRRPERDYLAWLRPERPDVSDAYGASGRSACVRT